MQTNLEILHPYKTIAILGFNFISLIGYRYMSTVYYTLHI